LLGASKRIAGSPAGGGFGAKPYRVSFVTKDVEAERWFNVKSYVGLLCDHLASILRAAVRATPIETLHGKSAEVLRGAILGEKRGEERRVGRLFEENGMWIYDVEVLDVRILDEGVKKLLADAQRAAITSEVGMLGNKHFAAELTKNLEPLAILGGDVMGRLLGALPIGASEGGEGIRWLLNGRRRARTAAHRRAS